MRRFTPFDLEWARRSSGTRAPFHRILHPYAQDGIKLARALDNTEKEIKRRNIIRRKVNLPLK